MENKTYINADNKEYVITYKDESKAWYKDGINHRDGGPAIENSDGTKYWIIHGKLHREDGPAAEYRHGSHLWFIKSVNITNKVEKWIKDNNIPHYSTWTKKEIALFKLTFIN